MAACPKCNTRAHKNSQRLFVCPRHGELRNVQRQAMKAQPA